MSILLRIYYFLVFLVYYLKTVIQANLALAVDILTPELRMSATITEVKLKTKKESHILALSNLLCMTPGSLTLDYDQDNNSLIVHIMYSGHEGSFQKSADDLQKLVMKIF